MKTEIESLAEQYFIDLERDNRQDTRENLRGWLWFTCPAHLRTEVAEAIEQKREVSALKYGGSL